tara:strand:- start:4404 stop:5078 length:675 start_codon:yes stop_codon:yes gene_type:complete
MNIDMEYINYYKIMFTSILYSETKNKKIILEPISCIVKLILLNYKKEGTKISISNNSIDFYEPSNFQGLLRNINGDGREDLHNIYHPILKCIEWYPPNEDTKYEYFYRLCRDGIQKLINAYDKDSTISRALELYCKNLTDAIDKKDIEKGINDDNEEEKDSPLLDTLKEFWKKEEIDLLYSLFQIVEKNENEQERITYIENIINTVQIKEKKLYDLIQQTSTTY